MTPPPDQAALKTMEAISRRRHSPVRRWVEEMPDAAVLVRDDGTIADLNHYAEALFGYRREEVVGQDLSVLIPERFREDHAHHSAGYIHQPRPRAMGSGMELWGLRKDGREFPVDIALSPRQMPEGVHIVCSIRDLSARLQQAIGEQLAFERLVTDISTRFVRMPVENVDQQIVQALRQIVEFLDVDNGGFGELCAEDGSFAINHSFALPGIPVVPRILDRDFPWYTDMLRRGEIVRVQRLPDDLPAEAEEERIYTVKVGMKSHLSIPLKVGGSVIYMVGVASFRSYRSWPDEIVQRLQLLGEIFASALMRKRAQEALQESEGKFRLLAETATCGIGIYQGNRFRYINPRASEITGYSADELLTLSVKKLVHPDFRNLVLERAQKRLRGEPVPTRYELKIVTKQGEERWVDFSASMTHYKGEPAIIGTAFDVTERKKAEESLHELGGRLIQAQEEERTRLARELHDDLSQRLALLSIELEEVCGQLPGSRAAAGKQLRQLGKQTREIGTDIHRISRQLHPSQLEVLGLVPAVRSFCSDLSKQKDLAIEFKDERIPQELPPDVALCLYRVVQEGLQNICKHSGARQARVRLAGTSGALHLSVVDDGAGFDPDSLGSSAGLGLVSMRERVRLVHGEFSIRSQPGRGTHLEVSIPLAGGLLA